MIVGDLTRDAAAQSFISLANADAYLAPEGRADWLAAGDDARSAALVRASRWLAARYRFGPLTPAGLTRLGHVAARIAAETLDTPIFAGTDTARAIKTAKAGSASITYQDGLSADAAGLAWPWLAPMLDGLIRRGSGIGALVV